MAFLATGVLPALLLLFAAAPSIGAVTTDTCTGDCNASAAVTVDEVIAMVNVALGDASITACPAGDADANGQISIDEIMAATHNVLSGCFAAPPTEPACPQRNPLRNVYFGDLHVHTRNSFDAYLWDTRTTPMQAYRFARGEPLALPPLDANGNGTRTVRLARPLDFAAVTDHSEFLGEVESCTTPGWADLRFTELSAVSQRQHTRVHQLRHQAHQFAPDAGSPMSAATAIASA